jgi:hypothetical protein
VSEKQTQGKHNGQRVTVQFRLRPDVIERARDIAKREGLYLGRVFEWALDRTPKTARIVPR